MTNNDTTATLSILKADIEFLAEEVRTLKSEGGGGCDSKNVMQSKVASMLDKKKQYAKQNNGIGVDGKPYEETMSKSDKKKQKRKPDNKAPADSGGVQRDQQDGGGGGGDEPSKGAQKKAAKKAEAKAKKAAMKSTGSDNKDDTDDACAARLSSDPVQEASTATAVKVNGSTSTSSSQTTPIVARTMKAVSSVPITSSAALAVGALNPMDVAINPNSPIHTRPVITIATAVHCNMDADLTLVSDHKRVNCALGGRDGCDVVGDTAMARYILRHGTARSNSAMEISPTLMNVSKDGAVSVIDSWVDYANNMMQHSPNLVNESRIEALLTTINNHLTVNNCTYLVGYGLSLADLSVYASCGWPCPMPPVRSSLGQAVMDACCADGSPFEAARRWMNSMSNHPTIRMATQLVMGIANNTEVKFDNYTATPPLAPLYPGMVIFEGALPGQVCTRFPPEPSGYLHIGHVKAVLLNDYYAKRYNGRLIVRFDDTNPSKEKEEFEHSIIEDLTKLGVKADVVTYTSDYFNVLRGYAIELIRRGLAFMDDTPQEQMQAERLNRQESTHRNQSCEEAMKYFDLMSSGAKEGGKWCLRAKIDMNSVNGTMRDPVIYRQNTAHPHHRSGTLYKAYPTYDLACPIVDSLEGVTHALRTTEYNDRDEQYYYLQRVLGLRRTRIHSFARMNFMFTELSKRKLTWFVENGVVSGWDDPRFPTVRGVVRRGIHIDALRNFILSQGTSRRVTLMEWSKFWAENKKEIDKAAKRFMAIDSTENVKLTVLNGPNESEYSFVTAACHPKDPSLGRRVVRLCNEVILEKVDMEGIVVGEDIVLMRWGVVNITKVDGGLEGNFVPDGDIKAAKRKLSWLSVVKENTKIILTEFDNLISKEKLEEGEDFKDFVNPHTIASSEAIGDAALKNLQEHDVIQLERRGYFRVDRPYLSESKPLALFMIPDGKSKPMSGLVGKLAHR